MFLGPKLLALLATLALTAYAVLRPGAGFVHYVVAGAAVAGATVFLTRFFPLSLRPRRRVAAGVGFWLGLAIALSHPHASWQESPATGVHGALHTLDHAVTSGTGGALLLFGILLFGFSRIFFGGRSERRRNRQERRSPESSSEPQNTRQ
jgi:hypothetical protein